jgi:hypothetical protein
MFPDVDIIMSLLAFCSGVKADNSIASLKVLRTEDSHTDDTELGIPYKLQRLKLLSVISKIKSCTYVWLWNPQDIQLEAG